MTNTWQHICCAVTNGQASFYVNGVPVGAEAVQNPVDFYASTNTGGSPQYPWDGVMMIGYTESGTTPDYNFFNGLIYGIRVWSRTLSASEVQVIATTGVPPSTNGLHNAIMLNEGTGNVIHDSLTSLTGRVLTAQWSSDQPTFPAPAGLTFTNQPPIASFYIDLSHYEYFQTPVLSANTTYCFRASGRGGVGPLDRGDAMADAAFYPSFQPLTAATAQPDNTWEWVGHMPFRPTPDVFNPVHIYYFYFQGGNSNETMIFQDNPYSDNVGGFSVDLFLVSGNSCVPHAATATATLDNGFLVGATITDGGCGYTNTPGMRIIGGGGSGAQAVAVVSNGVVTAINVLEAGSEYTNTPVVVIAPPFIPQPTTRITALLFGPLVPPVVELDLANLSPYDNYQLEFTPVAGGAWTNLGSPFTPTASTNTQYVNASGNLGFLRVKHVH